MIFTIYFETSNKIVEDFTTYVNDLSIRIPYVSDKYYILKDVNKMPRVYISSKLLESFFTDRNFKLKKNTITL